MFEWVETVFRQTEEQDAGEEEKEEEADDVSKTL